MRHFDDPEEARIFQIEATLETAQEFLAIEKYGKAEALVRKALALQPDHPWALYLLARAEIGQGRIEDALKTSEELIAETPDSDRGFATRAEALQRLGRLSEAESAILRALRIDPQNAFNFRVYAVITLMAGQLEKAEALVTEALRLEPDVAAHASLQAMIRAELQKGGDAEADSALALEPDEAYTHFARGQVHLLKGRAYAARSAFREAVRLDPTDEDYLAAYREADRCCRFVFWPQYQLMRLFRHLPGGPFGLWGVFVGLQFFILPLLGVSDEESSVFTFSYLGLVAYTWISGPLVNLWIKLRPLR